MSEVQDIGLPMVSCKPGRTPPVHLPADVRDRVRVVSSRSPTEFIPVADRDLESVEQQVPSSITVSTQAPSQVGALAHPPPFTRVVGFAQHHKSTYSLAVYGCPGVGRHS